MAEFNKKQQYQRWILPAQPSPLYPLAYNFVLVNSIDELKTILKTPFTEISFDTETTGLDLDEAFLVGYSFCFDGRTAYYVPVDHAEYEVLSEITKEEYISLKEQGQTNIKESEKKYYIINQIIKPGLGSEAVFLFYKRILLCKNVFMFNARFDIKVFEKYGFVQNNVPYETRYEMLNDGIDMSKVNFLDVQVLVFLADTNVPYPSLKKSEEYFLGWRGASFEETLGDVENFYYLKPEEAYVYAATDALGTFLLAKELMPIYYESYEHTRYQNTFNNDVPYVSSYLDNKFLYPLMIMEEELVNIDVDKLKSYSEYYQNEIDRVEDEAFSICGQAFNMGSPKQKSEMFKLLGITTYNPDGSVAVNKRGELKSDKNSINNTLSKYSLTDNQRKFMQDILNYASLSKQKGTYTDNFIEMCSKSHYGNRLRFSYKTMVVPSGRLAAGGDKKNHYYADSNIQNITKPKIGDVFYIHKDTLKELGLNESLYDNPRQEYNYNGENTYMILDWVFKETPWNIEYNEEYPNHFIIEGFKQHLNIRSVFCPDDDKYWVSCDFSAQELRLPALISKEPLWTETFASGGDLHKEMAIRMWGKENYSKQKRKMAKKANFGILYGMTAKNFAEDFGIPLYEAEDLVKRYKETAPVLFNWVHQNEKSIIETGTGYTICGRPRRLGWYLNFNNHNDRGLYNFGIRSCTNTVIQGSGADVLKISFMNIYDMFFKSEYIRTNRKYIKFLNTVHDEINYQVSKDNIRHIVPKIISCMRLWLDDWEFPMQVGLDIGTRWGQTVAFDYDGRPYVKIDEQGYTEGEKRYRFYDYNEVNLQEGIRRKLVGKKRYVEDPNGDYVVNKHYLEIQGPAGDPYNPKDFYKEEVKEEVRPEIKEEVTDDFDFTSYIDGQIGDE